MKRLLFLQFLMLLLSGLYAQNNVGIGTQTPHASAALDVSSTSKGMLAPVMTKAQRDAIANPANGLLITCTNCPTAGLHQYMNGAWEAILQNNTQSIGNYGTVVNPITGKVWLDRNLGASRVALAHLDILAVGHCYQWGRGADGHQLTTSGTTTTKATDWLTGFESVWKGRFITTSTTPNNWLSTGETHMWSGTAAQNNPCPSGFRIPTAAEWEQERLTWSTNNSYGAFESPLKLVVTQRRQPSGNFEAGGYYWSSTVKSDGTSLGLYFGYSNVYITNFNRASGMSVRCIKD